MINTDKKRSESKPTVQNLWPYVHMQPSIMKFAAVNM